MLRRVRYCYSNVVRLSVTLRYRDHIGLKSSKMISRLVSLGCSLFAIQTSRIYSERNTPKFLPEYGWGVEKSGFRPTKALICSLKCGKIEPVLLLRSNRKSYTRLDDLGWPWRVIMHTVSKHVRLSKLTVKFWMKIDPHCQWRRFSQMTSFWQYKVCADIWGGSLERDFENMEFHGFRRHIFCTLRNEAEYYRMLFLIHCRRNIWPWMTLHGLNVHYMLPYCDLPLSSYFLLLIYCCLCTARDPHGNAGSGV